MDRRDKALGYLSIAAICDVFGIILSLILYGLSQGTLKNISIIVILFLILSLIVFLFLYRRVKRIS
ncbi:hypothetical protein KDK_33290 [Dictyobacter kobayashii]|uniref:Uncharacterized protein n=1 Tax=Dictyobacter kobayashii TaxID=2014872 RepID=A0A402AKE6_9CHLR|nr:hypothetical protein KDK_33290 [Dictyobacter kobayashii]